MDRQLIRAVFIGTEANPTVGVFDETNKRIPELSGTYDLVHEKLFDALKNQAQAPGFMDQRVAKALVTATAPRGTG